MKIERVDVHRLAIPLTRPYKLAFGPVTQYDTILVDVTGDGGQRGFGEATLLTGYTDETVDDSERLAYDVAADLPGMAAAEACIRMRALGERAPFVATATEMSVPCTDTTAGVTGAGARKAPRPLRNSPSSRSSRTDASTRAVPWIGSFVDVASGVFVPATT